MATSKVKDFKNKRVLITAGPTWVPIDKVRVISNIATGETGILLAQKLMRLGASVTLILGPVGVSHPGKNIRLLRFRFFDELKRTLLKELRLRKYDAVIQAAAVSDYMPLEVSARKIKSDKKSWQLRLVPTAKIIDLIKKVDPSIFLVGFKFEPDAGKSLLVKRARELIRRSGLGLAVANSFKGKRYRAYIVSGACVCGPLKDKAGMAEGLISAMREKAWKK